MERAQSSRSSQLAVIVAVVTAALLVCMWSGQVAPITNDPGPLGAPVSVYELEAVIAAQIVDANVAGAVVVIDEANTVRERVALGQQSTGPAEPMTEDAVFNFISLTKAVATATAILQLAERGRLELDVPASRCWSAFDDAGKTSITLRQLLNHTSGPPSGLVTRSELRSHATVLHAIEIMPSIGKPGRSVIYSDLSYVALGEFVQRVSGMGLDAWCAQHIFRPLGMRGTAFCPSHRATACIAPTIVHSGRWPRGNVHDPTAAALGGVFGNTGLFSTAGDLVLFARMLLNGGSLGGHQILQPDSVALLLTSDGSTVVEATCVLGWEVQAPLIPNRYRALCAGPVQHLGHTGAGLWIDSVTRRFVTVLMSRLYPDERGNATPLCEAVLNLVPSTALLLSGQQIVTRAPIMADAVAGAEWRLPMMVRPIRTGIDVLEASGFAPLVGRRVGLATNHSGLNVQRQRIIDASSQAPGVRLNATFVPEYGIGTDLDACFGDTIGPRSDLVVHNLYDNSKAIPCSALADLDALAFDLQDVGVWFFTHLATLGTTPEAVAKVRIPVLVLDCPNPFGGDLVGGPVLDTADRSLVNYVPLLLLHDTTVGEFAGLLNGELHTGAALHVVAMEQYDRVMRFIDTRLGWVPSLPNLRDLSVLERYPDVGLVEGVCVSVGRGTTAPFGMVGVSWMDGAAPARELNALDTGAIYTPVYFVPTEGPYHGRSCSGVAIQRVPALTRPGRIGLVSARVLLQRYSEQFKLEAIRTSVGSETVWVMLRDGTALDAIGRAYTVQADVFFSQRAAYLLC